MIDVLKYLEENPGWVFLFIGWSIVIAAFLGARR